MDKYCVIPLITTKKGNHVFSCGYNILILDKMGNKAKPIYVHREKLLFASKPGNFVIYKEDNYIKIFQIVKIIRKIEDGYENYRIQDIPYQAINYKAVFYYINSKNILEDEWELPLIERIKKEVECFDFNR